MTGLEAWFARNPSRAHADPIDVANFVWDTKFKDTGRDRTDFETWFLGAPINSKSFTGHEYGDIGPTTAVKNVAQLAGKGLSAAGEFIKEIPGDIYESVTTEPQSTDYIYSKRNEGALPPHKGVLERLTDLYGDEEDLIAAYLKKYPTHKMVEDDDGISYAVDENGEFMGYPNPKGVFDRQSVNRGVANAIAFTPAAQAAIGAGVVGAGSTALNLLARAGTSFAANTVTDAATQYAGGLSVGDDLGDVNIPRSLGVGAMTAIPDALAIPIGRGAHSFGRYLKVKYEGVGKKRSSRGVIELGKRIAREFDYDLTDREALAFGRAYIQYGPDAQGVGRVNPESMLDEVTMGTQPLRSQRMIVPDSSGISSAGALPPDTARAQARQRFARAHEENVSIHPLGTNPVKAAEINDQKSIEAIDKIIDSLGPRLTGGTKPKVAVQRAQKAVRNYLQRESDEISALYQPALDNNLEITGDQLTRQTAITESLPEYAATTRHDPVTGQAITEPFRSYTGSRMALVLRRAGISRPQTTARQSLRLLREMEVDWDDTNTFRDLLERRDLFDELMNSSRVERGSRDFRGLSAMRNEWNVMIRESLENIAEDFGNQPASTAYLAAESALRGDTRYTEFAKQFIDGDYAAGVLKRIRDAFVDNTSPYIPAEELSNLMFGVDSYSKPTGAIIARGFRDVLGADSRGWDAVRQAALRGITTNNGEPLTGKALSKVLTDFLEGRGQSTAKILYSKSELRSIRNVANGLKRIISGDDLSPNSIEAIERRVASTAPNWMQSALFAITKRYQNWQSIQIPSANVRPGSIAPFVADAASDEIQRDQLGSDPNVKFPF